MGQEWRRAVFFFTQEDLTVKVLINIDLIQCYFYDSTYQVFSMSLVKKNWYASPIKAS